AGQRTLVAERLHPPHRQKCDGDAAGAGGKSRRLADEKDGQLGPVQQTDRAQKKRIGENVKEIGVALHAAFERRVNQSATAQQVLRIDERNAFVVDEKIQKVGGVAEKNRDGGNYPVKITSPSARMKYHRAVISSGKHGRGRPQKYGRASR